MPKTKQFESLSLEIPFKIQLLSMEEVSSMFYDHICKVYDLLNANKIATFENADAEKVYFVYRESSSEFVVKTCKYEGGISFETLDGISFVNFLFATAPFIAAVGEEKGSFY